MRYRVYKYKDVLGKQHHAIESKQNIFCRWWHVDNSTKSNIQEVLALRFLLENGESAYSPFNPTERIKHYEIK